VPRRARSRGSNRRRVRGKTASELNFHRRFRIVERLHVRVRDDELNAFDAGFDHSIDGVSSAAADSDDFDFRPCHRCSSINILIPLLFI
jgi:hypothetical protein